MPKTIIIIYELIIVDKVLITRIVWWIDVNDINLPGMCIAKIGECVKIIALNDDMIGILVTVDNCLAPIFVHNGYLFFQFVIDLLGRVFPHKSIFRSLC